MSTSTGPHDQEQRYGQEPVPHPSNRFKHTRWTPLWAILHRHDKYRSNISLDEENATPRPDGGESFEMASENQNSVFADATRAQGHTHCHSFHTIVPSLWGKQRRQEWLSQPNGKTIFANLGNMVRGGRLPGELVDRLNGPCAGGHKCQYFSPASGYYFDESKQGWQPFRNTGYSSRDEAKANSACDTLDDASKSNRSIMSQQMKCMHQHPCLGGVYNDSRGRCMCLTTQDETHEKPEDHHTGKDGDAHVDHKDSLPPMQRTMNHFLLGVVVFALILLVVTYYSYSQHVVRLKDLKQGHIDTLKTNAYK